MKITRYVTLLGFAAAVTLTANNAWAQVDVNNRTTMPGSGMDGQNGNPHSMQDTAALQDLVDAATYELQLAQFAQDKASKAEVKAYAQLLVEDNAKIMSAVQPSSKTLGVKPSKKASKMFQTEQAKLSSLSGADFDKEFLNEVEKALTKISSSSSALAQAGGTDEVRNSGKRAEPIASANRTMAERLVKS